MSLSKRPIEIPERPRIRHCSPVVKPPEQRQHSGYIFGDGRPLQGGRAHFSTPDHMDGVGVSSMQRTALFAAGSTFKHTRPLPSTVVDSPRRRAPSPVTIAPKVGRKFIAPTGNGNLTEHIENATPRASPMRTARAHLATPRDNLGAGLSPNPEAKPSPARGVRHMDAPPPFQPEPFRPRPYSPQLRRVDQKPSDSRDFMSFDPTNRPCTPTRFGRRIQAPQRTYDVITGQEL